MKDNQMKQAEDTPIQAIVRDALEKAQECNDSNGYHNAFDIDLIVDEFSEAKLTTSQVSEPSSEVLGTIERLLSQEMDVCVANGATSVSMPDDLVGVACWIHGVTPTTTPQEAISPAIAEYTCKLEELVTAIHNSGDCGHSLESVMCLIASKPTGLE